MKARHSVLIFICLRAANLLIRKKDILTLARENKDCIFLAFTNGTLVDDAFCEGYEKVR